MCELLSIHQRTLSLDNISVVLLEQIGDVINFALFLPVKYIKEIDAMKVVAILGGLGSQMMKYSFLLFLEKEGCECIIDTSSYFQEKGWNGYELKRVFNINHPDLRDLYSEEMINRIKKRELSPCEACFAFFDVNTLQQNYIVDGKARKCPKQREWRCLNSVCSFFLKIKWYYDHIIKSRFVKEYKYDSLVFNNNVFAYIDDFEHRSNKYLYKNIEYLKELFCFPDFERKEDYIISNKMLSEESVALHIRRSDHMFDHNELYRRKYFKKAVEYIRKKTKKAIVLYVFSEDKEWCRDNMGQLGIEDDTGYYIVDWHNDKESFRDMQLMTYCKHNILAKSTFAYWGYYLSRWEMRDKIVVAPKKYWNELDVHL